MDLRLQERSSPVRTHPPFFGQMFVSSDFSLSFLSSSARTKPNGLLGDCLWQSCIILTESWCHFLLLMDHSLKSQSQVDFNVPPHLHFAGAWQGGPSIFLYWKITFWNVLYVTSSDSDSFQAVTESEKVLNRSLIARLLEITLSSVIKP